MISRSQKLPFVISYQEFSISVCRTASWHPTDEELRSASRFTARDVTPRALFVADPMLAHDEGTWHLLFELMPRRSRRGVIGRARSEDLQTWTYEGVVLAEPFHLSFPFVFRWNDDWWMVPETSEKNEIRLYRADPFPRAWKLERVLMEGRFSDSVLWEHGGVWFLLTSPRMETARLFTGPAPVGPWTEHPASPIVDGDLRSARPAGPTVWDGARWIRTAQYCEGTYGREVSAYSMTELSPDRYAEQKVGVEPILGPSREPWRLGGMHHLHCVEDSGGRKVCACDGWRKRRLLGL